MVGSVMKNNIDFYQHFANADQHLKFKMLRVEFGWAGEGRFWALNNRIAEAEDCCLDVSKKYNRAGIASDLGFTLEEMDTFLKFLLEECELIRKCPDGKITTDIVQECYVRVMADREKARERVGRRLPNKPSASPEKETISPEKSIIVKESKDITKVSGNGLPYKKIVGHLNQKANTNYRSTTKATQRYIKARFNEGFTLNDFLSVIDNKSYEWRGDPKMVTFLRPETLFGTKFESYLQKAKPEINIESLATPE